MREIEVLRDVNLSLSDGELVSIIGPSGSGKTTLLNIVSCLEKPTDGEVVIGGEMVNSLNDEELSMIRRLHIGMIFQEFYLLPELSALENVELPMILNGVPEGERKERAGMLLASIGLGNRTEYRPGELSKGEQQRVTIARALANDPSLILADEPTGNLDTETGERIVEILRTMADSEKAVLMVTHNLEQAFQVSHRVLNLERGVLTKAPSAL
jgi:putative ABC transport system ATP-binding protein